MVRRLVPRSLRAQLACAIWLVAIVAVVASFFALYNGTTARMQGQIDSQLRTQLAEWRQLTAGSAISSPGVLRRTARRFIADQRYHAEALVIVVQGAGMRPVTNNPDLLAAVEAREHGDPDAAGLLNSPSGLATAPVAEAGSMRVLTVPIDYGGRRVGTLHVANPLTAVERAQASLRRTFLIVGAATLLLAIAAGIAIAGVIAAPLRRISRVAAAAGAGDLSVRAAPVAKGVEVGMLAAAVDNMLKRLEQAFKRQRDFVSDASHELRTPLAVARAQVELLDHEHDARRRHEGTQTLLRRLDQLDRLVGDLLTLASAEAGQLIEPRTIELEGFFEDLRRDLPLFGQRDFRLAGVDGTLRANPDRLTQVLRNLVRNAVTHTDPGDRVLITARGLDDRLEITVSDTGPGIAPDQLEHVFERFQRLDRGRSRDTGGSGLGLAIARAIVEAHGGSIHAESTPGGGATFRLELPGYSHGPGKRGETVTPAGSRVEPL